MLCTAIPTSQGAEEPGLGLDSDGARRHDSGNQVVAVQVQASEHEATPDIWTSSTWQWRSVRIDFGRCFGGAWGEGFDEVREI